MARGAARIMFYTGLRFPPFSFNSALCGQLLLTAIIPLKEGNERRASGPKERLLLDTVKR